MKSEKITIKNKKILIVIALFLFLFLIPDYTDAALVPCGTPDNPCQFCHLFVLLNNIMDYFFVFILPVVATGLIAWGGFIMLTAGESEDKFKEAKTIITAVIIGLVIILSSWLLLNTFMSAIGIAEWTGLGSWWKIKCP